MELLSERECNMVIAFAESSMRLNVVARKFDTDAKFICRRFDKIKDRLGLDARNFYDLVKLVDLVHKQT